MNDSGMISRLFNRIDTILDGVVVSNFAAINGYILPMWTSGVLIYYIYVVWEMIYGNKEMIVGEFLKQFMVLSLITAALTASSVYLDVIVPFVDNAGIEISNALNAGGQGYNQIDDLMEKVLKYVSNDLDKNTGWTQPINSIICFIRILFVCLSFFSFVIYATVYLIMAKVMVCLLLCIGGVFIMFSAFPATRQMFTAWIGTALNYIMLNICYALMFKIIISFVADIYDANLPDSLSDTVETGFTTTLSMCMVFILGTFLLGQISSFVSVLTGGVGINGLTSAVGGAMSSAIGGAKSVGRGMDSLTGFSNGMKSGAKYARGMAKRGAMAAFNKATGRNTKIKGG